jgi:hypothetical protein
MLYAYCYLEIFFWHQAERLRDFKANVQWIKKNGVYKGE